MLLNELIEQRRQKALEYQEYLEEIRQLAKKVKRPGENTTRSYPPTVNTPGKRALYDNIVQDEVLVAKIDAAIRYTKKADWLGDRFKEREIANAIREELNGIDIDKDIENIMALIRVQKEYR